MSKLETDRAKISSTVTKTCETLWRKVGVEPYSANQRWTIQQLEKGLERWEFNFLIAAMHHGVSDQGGWVHGLHVHFDEPDSNVYLHPERLIDAWRQIGSEAVVRAIQFGLRRRLFLRYRKFEEMSAGEWEQLEAQIDEDVAEEGPSASVLLAGYAERQQSVYQD